MKAIISKIVLLVVMSPWITMLLFMMIGSLIIEKLDNEVKE